MSKRPLFFVVLFCVFSLPASLLPAQNTSLSWYSWGEGIAKAARDHKKVLLYVYTPSCGWCKKMESETFAQSAVVQLVKAEFIPVKLNAAESADLEFKGKTYRLENIGSRGYNALAAELLEGRMSFPSLVFLDESQHVLQAIAGFKSPDAFLPIATYYGKDHYKNMPWSSFQKKYAAGN